jgi:hypothetical protein
MAAALLRDYSTLIFGYAAADFVATWSDAPVILSSETISTLV